MVVLYISVGELGKELNWFSSSAVTHEEREKPFPASHSTVYLDSARTGKQAGLHGYLGTLLGH